MVLTIAAALAIVAQDRTPLRAAPSPRATELTTLSNLSVCSATVGTPYLVSSVIAWVATAGEQLLQWPTPTIAASPRALISSQVLGSSC